MASSSRSTAPEKSKTKGCFDLRTICKELSRVPDKLIAIGVQLGISHNKVTKFMKEDEPLSAVINFWLSGNVKKIPLNWQSIVKALKSGHVDETKLANKIISRYQLDDVDSTSPEPSQCPEDKENLGIVKSKSTDEDRAKRKTKSRKKTDRTKGKTKSRKKGLLHDHTNGSREYTDLKRAQKKIDEEQYFLDIESKNRDIKKKFVYLCNTFFNSLQSRKIEVSALQGFFVEYLSTLEDYPNREKIIDEVSKAESIFRVRYAVINCYSFFNFEMIEELIKMHGSDQDKEELKTYNQSFREFCTMMCKNGMRCHSDSRNPGERKVTFKLDSDHDKLPVKVFNSFRRNISIILDVREVDLNIVKIRKGCLNLEFLVSESAYQHIIELLQSRGEDRIKLFKESITSIQISDEEEEATIISPRKTTGQFLSKRKIRDNREVNTLTDVAVGNSSFTSLTLARKPYHYIRSLDESSSDEDPTNSSNARDSLSRRKLLSDVTSQPDSEATSDAATEHLPSSSVDSHKLPDSSLAIIRPYTKRRNFKKVKTVVSHPDKVILREEKNKTLLMKCKRKLKYMSDVVEWNSSSESDSVV